MELLQLSEARAISRKTENTGFTCENCGAAVAPLRNGSYRNHCPFCLYSKHVDERPGDRACPCHGLMEPIALEYRSRKGYVIVHRGLSCGFVRPNRVADDPRQPDDSEAVTRLLQRGLAFRDVGVGGGRPGGAGSRRRRTA